MKLSKHSKKRMIERANVNKNQESFFRNALRKGKSPGELQDGPIKNYLMQREGRCQIKLYRNYVFIHSKNSKRLYTVYKLPSELLKKEGE